MLSLTYALAVVASTGQVYRANVGLFGPEGTLLFRKPTVRLDIASTDGLPCTASEMLLNGKKVNAKYEPTEASLVHEVDAPLNPGEYTVECKVTFGNRARFAKRWSMRVDSNAVSEMPAPNTEQADGIRLLNEFRRSHGLPAYRTNASLSFVAQRHAQYLKQNNTIGHVQVDGSPGFFGRSVRDRLALYGYLNAVTECATGTEETVQEALVNLTQAPYHRIPFLTPLAQNVGFGRSGDRTVLIVDVSTANATTLSPSNGQRDVPVEWINNESPNPLRFYAAEIQREKTTYLGHPIVIAHYTTNRLPFVAATMALRTGQQQVPGYLNTPLTDNLLKSEAIFVPKAPLKPNTLYQAEFDGKLSDGTLVSQRWSFTTGNGPSN
ncbi:MAG: CAP domain-containing protein [Fimbriimonadaceae bacterium]|nr:CAP domain-containing protein [Fimbriimonadaceae bacterium]